MDVRLGPYTTGIDHVSPDTGLSHTAVRDAVNVDFDREGNVARRPGLVLKLASAAAGTVFRSRNGRNYIQDGTSILEATYQGSTLAGVARATLASADPVSFADLLDRVVYCNRTSIGVLHATGSRGLGVESPNSLTAAPDTIGGMDAGAYAVGVSFTAGDEEGALSALAFVTVPEGGGIRLGLPQPLEGIVSGINVYCTQVNGDEASLAFRTRFPTGMPNVLLGRVTPGRKCAVRGLERMPPGNIVRHWNGRLLVARGNALYVSDPLRYGLYSPRYGFVAESNRIVMVEPVKSGVFVGTAAQTVFFGGANPREWTRDVKACGLAIPFTGIQVDAGELGGDVGASGEYVGMWLTKNGYVVGTSAGLVQPQRNRITLNAESGALAVSGRKAVAVVV